MFYERSEEQTFIYFLIIYALLECFRFMAHEPLFLALLINKSRFNTEETYFCTFSVSCNKHFKEFDFIRVTSTLTTEIKSSHMSSFV